MIRVVSLICLVALAACQQTKAYTPELAPLPVRIEALSGAAIAVTDLRVEKADGDAMRARLEEQLRQAIPNARSSSETAAPRLSVDVIEQRSYFTLGKWHGATRLRARVDTKDGKSLGPWDASGSAERANSMGYTSAKRVSQDSYNAAIADLISKLRAEVRP